MSRAKLYDFTKAERWTALTRKMVVQIAAVKVPRDNTC